MATLIQAKQIEGIVTASVIQGDFIVSGQIIATGSDSIFNSISSSGPIYGVRYDDIQGTPSFVGGTGILINQVGDTITITNTGGGGGGDVSAELISSVAQLNAYTGSNDIIILGLEQFTASIQAELDSLETRVSALESQTDNTGSDSQTLTIVGDQLTISGGNTITIPSGGGGTSDFTELTNVPSGLISGSTQISGLGFATTGSNIFYGDQIISGALLVSGANTFIVDGPSEFTGSVSITENLHVLGGITGAIDYSNLVNVPSGLISTSQQIIELGFSQTDLTGSDNQTISIVGDQLTISGGNTITIPTGGGGTSDFTQLTNVPSGLVSSSDQVLGGTGILSGSHTDISALNTFTASAESRLSALESATGSYLTSETDNQTLTIVGDQLTISDGNTITIPTGGTSDFTQLTNVPSGLVSGSSQITDGSGIVSGSVLRTLDGTGVLSGSKTDISSLNTFTESIDARVTSLESFSSSLDSTFATDSELTSLSASIATTIDGIQHTQIPSGVISGSTFTDFSSSVHTEIQNIQHTDVTKLNEFTSSIQSQVDSLTSATSSYLTELPSGLVSGSILPGTGITIDSSSGDYVITSAGGDGDTSYNGNREVTNTLLGDLFTDSYNAGTTGSIQDFLDAIFFPSYAPTATFTTQTSNLNTNVTADGIVIESISITDTVDDSPYVVTISGDSSDAFRLVPTNVDSSSWEIQSVDNLTAGTFTYDITVTDKNGASRTYSNRSVDILQANSGTFSTTGTLYIIESATSGPIYLGSNGRSGAQGGVSVSYSPNYGSQVAQNFTSTNSLISINSSTGVLSVGSPISGSGNLSGDTITTTIGWTDQYGNSSTSDISVNVTQNNAPDIVFTNTTSNLNTNNAKLGGGTLVTISFTDTESDSINHDSFQFTDPSGQLTATKNANNYLVTANSNLSGSTTYSITASIEDVHGFRSNTESSSFNIVQHSNGTLIGDTTMYIIESAVTNASFRDATGFGNGNTAQVSVTYSPSAGSQTVQSFNSSNSAILIDSSGYMTLGVDLSGSVTQSGDTISTVITFQDQYGNIGSGSVTANVFGNLAPSVTFVSSSNYDTDAAITNSTAGVITISDTETNSPYSVTLSGTDGGKFNAVPQNAASSSWQVQPTGSLSVATYSIDISVTDNYGESTTLSNKSIIVDEVASGASVYIYYSSYGSDAGFTSNYLAVMGGATLSGDTPPQVTSYTTNTLSPYYKFKTGDIGSSTITLAGGYTATLAATVNGSNLNEAIRSAGGMSWGSAMQTIIVIPKGSPMGGIPTSMTDGFGGSTTGEYVMVEYADSDNAPLGGASSVIHSLVLDTAKDGYNEWYVIGATLQNNASTMKLQILPSSGSISNF